MVVEKASDRVRGRAPRSFQSRFNDGGSLRYVSRKRDPSLRFFFLLRGLYRRKGIVRGGASWPHHGVVQPRAGPRPPVVSLALGSPPSCNTPLSVTLFKQSLVLQK
jgi:hypothetical protein